MPKIKTHPQVSYDCAITLDGVRGIIPGDVFRPPLKNDKGKEIDFDGAAHVVCVEVGSNGKTTLYLSLREC